MPLPTYLYHYKITAVASGITLSECLVGAIRLGLADLEQAFVDVLQQEISGFCED